MPLSARFWMRLALKLQTRYATFFFLINVSVSDGFPCPKKTKGRHLLVFVCELQNTKGGKWDRGCVSIIFFSFFFFFLLFF